MGAHLSAHKKFEVVQNLIKKGCSIRQYCIENPQYAESTLSDWKRNFISEMKRHACQEKLDQTTFIDITEESKEIALVNSQTKLSIESTHNRDDLINTTSVTSSKSNIKLSSSDFTLEFDVSVLREVIEVLK